MTHYMCIIELCLVLHIYTVQKVICDTVRRNDGKHRGTI